MDNSVIVKTAFFFQFDTIKPELRLQKGISSPFLLDFRGEYVGVYLVFNLPAIFIYLIIVSQILF